MELMNKRKITKDQDKEATEEANKESKKTSSNINTYQSDSAKAGRDDCEVESIRKQSPLGTRPPGPILSIR